MKKILAIIILLVIIIYFVFFVFSKKVNNQALISTCVTNNEIKVELRESFYYLSSLKTKVEKDTMFLDVYKTTIGNIFLSDKNRTATKKISLMNCKYIVVNNVKLDVEEIKCK